MNKKFVFSSIRTRILLITILFMLFFGAIASTVSYSIISDNIQTSMIQSSENRLTFLCSSIESEIVNVTGFVRSCQANKKVNAFATETDTTSNTSRIQAHEAISELYLSNSALSSQMMRMIILRKSKMDFIQVMPSAYSSVSVSAEKVLRLPFFETLRTHSGTAAAGIQKEPFLPKLNLSMIPLVYILQHPYKAEETGYIYVELATSVITETLKKYAFPLDTFFSIRLGNESYVYEREKDSFSAQDMVYTQIKDLSADSLNDNTEVALITEAGEKQNFLQISRPIPGTTWTLTEYIPYREVYAMLRPVFSRIVLAILFVISLLVLLLFVFLHRTVEVPVRMLLGRMERIKNGDFSRDASTEWNHEIGEIGKTINDLSENILTLMDQRIEDEKEKKDYEYRMLQSQINPHFLYNTLNSIKWMATVQCAPGIAEMTTSLSRLLKDISKGTSNVVTIEHEFNLIRDYFVIQQYRYGGTITMNIEVEEEDLLQSHILKFTLQPLVENAIFHGIEPKGSVGTIQIHLSRTEQGDVRIDVTDDGIGIMPDQAKNLLNESNEKNHSAFFREIGIHNVHKRLQYEFGPSYGLSISSVPGEYTTISVLLPGQRSES